MVGWIGDALMILPTNSGLTLKSARARVSFSIWRGSRRAYFEATRGVKKCPKRAHFEEKFCHVGNVSYFCREFLTQFNYGQRKMEMGYQVGYRHTLGNPRSAG